MRVDVNISAEGVVVNVSVKKGEHSPDVLDDVARRTVDIATAAWLVRGHELEASE